MRDRIILIGVLAIWGICFGGSFLHFHLNAPTGDGFTRGANRVQIFLAWQAAALVAAGVALLLAPRDGTGPDRLLRSIARVPMLVSGLMALAFVGLIGWLVYSA